MPQEQFNRDSRNNPRFNRQPGEDPNQPPRKGPRFSIYWIYAIIFAVLIGFQAVVFAVFTKLFAISEGLLPEDRRLQRAMRFITLEGGLAVGALLVLFGLAGSLYAVGVWGEASFGELNPVETLRLIVPAAVSLTLGFQVILCSFFLSVLGLRRR